MWIPLNFDLNIFSRQAKSKTATANKVSTSVAASSSHMTSVPASSGDTGARATSVKRENPPGVADDPNDDKQVGGPKLRFNF